MSYNPRKRQRLSPDPKDYPFVFFGTPLPPLDPEVRDDGTFVPLWKQEVLHPMSDTNPRSVMKEDENDYTVPLPVDFQLATSIP